MYYPSYNLFQKKARERNLIPVYQEILADKETPISIFLKINNNGENAFILENVECYKEWRGRYTFLGVAPRTIFRSKGMNVEILENGKVRKVQGNAINLLEKLLSTYRPGETNGLTKFNSGTIGYISYGTPNDIDLWDILFILPDTLIVFDNLHYKIKVIANAYVQDGDNTKVIYNHCLQKINNLIERLKTNTIPLTYLQFSSDEVSANIPIERYIQNFLNNEECVRTMDKSQVVLSQGVEIPADIDLFNIYRTLRTVIYGRYMIFMKIDGFDFILIGSSLKPMVRIKNTFDILIAWRYTESIYRHSQTKITTINRVKTLIL